MATLGVVVVSAIAFQLAHRGLKFWSVDDAGITYAYAIRLADAGSLSALPESMPVEGYSNPLLFFLVVLLRLAHLFDPITTHVKIEAIAFSIMSGLVFVLLRKRVSMIAALLGTTLFVTLELLTPSTWLWYRSGLENIFVSLALVTLLFVVDRARDRAFRSISVGLLAFLVALVRPEGPLYVAVFYGALVVIGRGDAGRREHLSRCVRAAAVTTAFYIAYLVWRRVVYGCWFANTYYVKVGGVPELGGQPPFASNLFEYVQGTVLLYSSSILFAAGAVVAWFVPPVKRLAPLLGVFAIVSLAMPVVGGRDLMGEHRFATQFFAMAHLCAAVALAGVLTLGRSRRELVVRGAAVCTTFVPLLLMLAFGHIAGASLKVNDVTIARVAEYQGPRRVEHQRRLGLIAPVVVAPDAGGALLMGSLQLVDNGYLTDFHMGHMRRDRALVRQYEVEERRADLVDENRNWPFDRTLVGPRYLHHRALHMFARRDLVDAEIPTTPALLERDGLRIFVSPDTVPFAGPSGLVRIELVVAWSGGAPKESSTLRARLGDDDPDTLPLDPYDDLKSASDHGTQRRALLLTAPSKAGTYPVTIELADGVGAAMSATLDIEVLAESELPRALAAIAAANLEASMRRIAWLREQWIPRLTKKAFASAQQMLLKARYSQQPVASAALEQLHWDFRLAEFERLPAVITSAEREVVNRALLEACTTDRALCIGRRIDRLRRLGYYGVLDHAPALREELEAIASTAAP